MNIAQMNKQELSDMIEQVAAANVAIEKRAKELEEESLKGSLLGSSLLQDGDPFMKHSYYETRTLSDGSEIACRDYNSFQDEKTAQAYAEAFNTMLGLRHCKGSGKVTTNNKQCIIDYSSGDNTLEILITPHIGYKEQCISPCYATRQDALNAIDTVGIEAIIKMFKTFSGN